MSENKREKMKVTIESHGRTTTIECCGLIGVAVDEKEDKMGIHSIIVGKMGVDDLVAAQGAIKENLMPELKKTIVESFVSSLINSDEEE